MAALTSRRNGCTAPSASDVLRSSARAAANASRSSAVLVFASKEPGFEPAPDGPATSLSLTAAVRIRSIERIRTAAVRLSEVAGPSGAGSKPGSFDAKTRTAELRDAFAAALADDLNTSEALGAVHPFLREVNAAIDAGSLDAAGAAESLAALQAADSVLGVLPSAPEALPAEIEAQIEARNAARKRRDFAE